ncbi:hypothetical protein [Streptomyces cavernae]|uniref:hypothetical protein n=1 Tax=Streptomyces cavernae TaxID=2259034 RepID=UPI000FEB7306|nr:hypothetical protein [Streptomyces cavernae]
MAIDPTDPETFEPSAEEEIDDEAPEADAAEQHTDLAPPDADYDLLSGDTYSADEADRAEQARFVALDEDDYR